MLMLEISWKPTAIIHLKWRKSYSMCIRHFGSLRSLQYLNPSLDDLEGEVSTGGIFDNATEIFVFGNRRLCGPGVIQICNCPLALSKPQKENITKDNLVGTGSFGSVYKGKMDPDDREGNDSKALVFEYMPSGSLEGWLHPKAHEHHQIRKLDLTQRLNIVIDVASALNYLHHDSVVPVVQCDLKPSNILLLDHDMTAHAGDFGFALLLSTSSSTASKNSSSWMGLKDPSDTSLQGDVYSYGIVLLEMLTGKKPTDDVFKNGFNLHKFVSKAFPERIVEILDPQILQEEWEEANNNSRNENAARMRTRRCITSLLRIGLSCSKESPKERIDMRDVANKLNTTKDRLSVVEIFEGG
ncbi:receptor kinase-like protein Xa21 [Elaeis guineensis]|uniref:receptor kinase-like protein Xa21 n=1 Tax=Elaeis guineensis var. tenera TaxID=51953 RepID=UPI003C6D2CDB